MTNLMKIKTSGYEKDFFRTRLSDVLRNTKGTDRAIYYTMLLLAEVNGDRFYVAMSPEALAIWTGITQRTCRHALSRLIDTGLIKRIDGGWELV